jgi:hypothetical protein
MIGRWVSLLAVRAAARAVIRLLAWIAAAALIVAALPVSLVAAASAAAAWLHGWPPRRLYLAALWCGPMVVAWLAAAADINGGRWLAQAPYRAWLAMWHLGAAGSIPAAALVISPAAVPVGIAAGGLAWSRRIQAMEAGAGGRSPAAAVSFEQRRWRHQVRTAQARIAAPGSVPLTTRGG